MHWGFYPFPSPAPLPVILWQTERREGGQDNQEAGLAWAPPPYPLSIFKLVSLHRNLPSLQLQLERLLPFAHAVGDTTSFTKSLQYEETMRVRMCLFCGRNREKDKNVINASYSSTLRRAHPKKLTFLADMSVRALAPSPPKALTDIMRKNVSFFLHVYK